MVLTDNQKGHLRHVKLNVWEVKMIQFIANDAGEVSFDWRNVKRGVREAMLKLADKQMIHVIHPVSRTMVEVASLVNNPSLTRIRLSDQGRQVMEALGAMTVQTS